MNKIMVAIFLFLAGWANVVYGVDDKAFGWKPVVDTQGKIVGMSNTGEQGGVLTLTCDAKSKRLKADYHFGGTSYDFYIFRRFGVVDMTKSDMDGKFYVGAGLTRQSDVYYNITTADKAFAIARFPVGSKAIWDHAISTQAPMGPQLLQEGDEVFLAGDDYQQYVKALSLNCPVNENTETSVF